MHSKSNIGGIDECCSVYEIRKTSPSLLCQQARSVLRGFGESDSSAAGDSLLVEILHRGMLQDVPTWNLVNMQCVILQ